MVLVGRCLIGKSRPVVGIVELNANTEEIRRVPTFLGTMNGIGSMLDP